MNRILNEHSTEIAAAMQGLCDAVGKLGRLRDAMAREMQSLPPGAPEEQTVLQLERACTHLAQAAVDVPEEVWSIMLKGKQVGAGELIARFTATMEAA